MKKICYFIITFIFIMGVDLPSGGASDYSFDNLPRGGSALDQAAGIAGGGGNSISGPSTIPNPGEISGPDVPTGNTIPGPITIPPPVDKPQRPIPPDEQKIRRQNAYDLNQKGVVAYKNRNWEDAIKYFKEALKYSPDDPVIRQNLKKAELEYEESIKYWEKVKDQSKAAEKKGDEALRSGNWHKAIEAYRSDPWLYYDPHVQQKLKKAFGQLKGMVTEIISSSQERSLDIGSISKNRTAGTQSFLGDGTLPLGLRKIGGLTDQEWREARGYQKEIEVLLKKWPLSAQEITRLEELELKRNKLLKKAVNVPGLTAEEREKLRLLLHTDSLYSNQSTVTIKKALINEYKKPDHYAAGFLFNQIPDLATSATEYGGSEFVEHIGGEKWVGRYENLHGISKIIMSAATGDTPAAISQTVELGIYKLVPPPATFGLEGGRLYSKFVSLVLDKTMQDLHNALGMDYDSKKFWEEYREKLNVVQKAFMDFVGFGVGIGNEE